jgi:hypothetical protein
VDSDDDGAEEEEEVRSRKKGRKSNGITRKVSPSPALSSDRASEGIQTFEPNSIKKWNALPSWENHLEEIDTVERTPDGDLLIYFKLFVVVLFSSATRPLTTCQLSLVGKVRKSHAKKIQKSARKSSLRRCASPLIIFTFSS